ncbi:hypothetical protein Tco_0328391 [Tanacetum coccineum]
MSRCSNTFHVSQLDSLCAALLTLHTRAAQFIGRSRLSVRSLISSALARAREELVKIMDREVKWLRKGRVPIVKVQWTSKRGLVFTWEREDQFRKKYPHLFTKTAPSSSAAS